MVNERAMNIKTLILRAPGTNCHLETALAVERAGGEPTIWPLQVLLDDPAKFLDFSFLILPGGFSYGDDISAGKVYANTLLYQLQEWVTKFRDKGGLILGICNGFQVLVKSGLLPWPGDPVQKVTLTDNDSARYECRWVRLSIDSASPCVFTRGLDGFMDLPVAHGEGKFLWADEDTERALFAGHLPVFQYMTPEGASRTPGAFPYNPNGSLGNIAGICDPSGQILGLMPHPERFQFHWHHPSWKKGTGKCGPLCGLDLFKKAIEALKN